MATAQNESNELSSNSNSYTFWQENGMLGCFSLAISSNF